MIVCKPVSDDCINLQSYGEICVHCNGCGRIDKSTQKEAQLLLYKRDLERWKTFDGWLEGCEEFQKKNIKSNIKWYEKKIKELEV